jgi:hypothetical protein
MLSWSRRNFASPLAGPGLLRGAGAGRAGVPRALRVGLEPRRCTFFFKVPPQALN